MLCDRENTHIAKAQPGFINYVVMPIYQVVVQILPKIGEKDSCIYNLKENEKNGKPTKKLRRTKKSINKQEIEIISIIRYSKTILYLPIIFKTI